MISCALSLRAILSCQGERQRHAGTSLPFTGGETEAERPWLFPHATLPEGGRDRFLAQTSGAGHNHEIMFCIFRSFTVSAWVCEGWDLLPFGQGSAESCLGLTHQTAFCGSGSDQTCSGPPHPVRWDWLLLVSAFCEELLTFCPLSPALIFAAHACSP